MINPFKRSLWFRVPPGSMRLLQIESRALSGFQKAGPHPRDSAAEGSTVTTTSFLQLSCRHAAVKVCRRSAHVLRQTQGQAKGKAIMCPRLLCPQHLVTEVGPEDMKPLLDVDMNNDDGTLLNRNAKGSSGPGSLLILPKARGHHLELKQRSAA